MLSKLQNLTFDQFLVPSAIFTAGIVALGLLAVLIKNQHRVDAMKRHWLSRLLYTVFLLSVAVLATTSFGSIKSAGHMEHYALLAHITVAGAFVFLLLAVAITHLPRGPATKSNWWWEKWSVWGLVVSGMLVSSTMFLSMVPVLSTSELLQAVEIHRFAGLATVSFTVLHFFSLIVGRLGWR
jgi:hypothetical protein